jgi:hypothetical protein
MSSQISLSVNVQIRQRYNMNELAALLAKSTKYPIYSEQTNWEGQSTITEFQACSSSVEALDLLTRNKYLTKSASCIVGSNFAEIRGFWIGDKAGDTEVLICNVPQKEIRTFLDSMKSVELLMLSDKEPFEIGGAVWDQWQEKAEKNNVGPLRALQPRPDYRGMKN